MTAIQLDKFNEEVKELKAKYPECVIETWNPDDFQELAHNELTEDDNVRIVKEIEISFDASVGINWNTIINAMDELSIEIANNEEECWIGL